MDIHSLIERHLNGIPYGTLAVTVKRHDSHNASLDFQKITSHKVDGNTKALEAIITMLKSLQATGESGFLTFTVTLQDGNATRIQVQDTQRVNL